MRDADGDSQRFTGEGIYERTGDWCMDRWRRDIPTVTTFYCREGGRYLTFTVAAVPERAVPLRPASGIPMRRSPWKSRA